MQKRAAEELFDWLGLDTVPIAYWQILAETRDPADGLAEFIIRSGFDPLKIRRRHPAELEAFRTLCQQECASRSAAEPVGNGLPLRKVVASLDEVLRLFRVSSATFRIRKFVLLVEGVEGLRRRPESVTIEEASAVLSEARDLAAASWRYSVVAARYRGITAELNNGWAGRAASIDDCAALQRLINTALTAERKLIDDAHCDIEEQISVFSASIEGLQSLIRHMPKRAREASDQKRSHEAREQEQDWIRGATSVDKDPSHMSVDELLALFRFVPGSRPTSSQVRSAFMRIAQFIQPRPGDANFVAKNMRYRQTIDAYKTLRAAMSD